MLNKSLASSTQRVMKSMVAVVGLGIAVSGGAADTTDANIAIDISELSTTKEEVALLQVLSEICPAMLPKNQQQGFSTAYNNELKRLMPTISDPRMAVQYLSTQQDYKQILNETRQWTLSYSKDENKAICTELAASDY